MHPLSPLGCRGQAPQPRSGASKTPGLRSATSGRNHSFCRRLPERLDTVPPDQVPTAANTHRPVHKRQIVSWEVADQHWRKIRSVAPLCPACCAAFAAGHHGCSLTCQAPICLACSRHTTLNGIAWTVELTTAFPSRCSALPAGSAGFVPAACHPVGRRHAAACTAAATPPFGR
jgi:hypothetical protein